MNVAYSEVVFAIINHVLDTEASLLSRYNSPSDVTEYDVRRIQGEVKAQIERAGATLEGSEEWENYAKYALVAWIDSLMIGNPFVGDHWSDLVLEVDYFETRGEAADEFFRRSEDALQKRYRNAVEVFFLCFVLGFRGIYNDPHALSGYRHLPPTAEEWQKRTAKLVLAGLDKTKIKSTPEMKFNNEPATGMRNVVNSLLVFLVFFVVLGATAYFAFFVVAE